MRWWDVKKSIVSTFNTSLLGRQAWYAADKKFNVTDRNSNYEKVSKNYFPTSQDEA